jgi:hypothetical protein
MSVKPGRAKTSVVTGRRLRRHPRYRSSFPVGVTFLTEGSYRQLAAHCKDLSKAGIGVLLAAELTLGEVASLNFALPGAHTWELRAVLRHRRGYHYGFEFFSLTQEQIESLATYLKGLNRADTD